MSGTNDITRLLHAARHGDDAALGAVLQTMYTALRELAANQLRRNRSEQTLSATALVNEAWLRVFGAGTQPDWESRRHLLGVTARAMREVLIDAARRRQAAKRPPDSERLDLAEIVGELAGDVDYAALGDCLDLLERIDPRQAQIVNLRFFAGLPANEIAAALDVSVTTVQREWRLARAWLRRELALTD